MVRRPPESSSVDSAVSTVRAVLSGARENLQRRLSRRTARRALAINREARLRLFIDFFELAEERSLLSAKRPCLRRMAAAAAAKSAALRVALLTSSQSDRYAAWPSRRPCGVSTPRSVACPVTAGLSPSMSARSSRVDNVRVAPRFPRPSRPPVTPRRIAAAAAANDEASRTATETSPSPVVDRSALETNSSRVTIGATVGVGAVGAADGAGWTMRACARSSVLGCAPIVGIGNAFSVVATWLALRGALVHPSRDVVNAHLCACWRGFLFACHGRLWTSTLQGP